MKKLLLYTSVIAGLAVSGCKKFVDVNTDPNNPLSVQEKLILAPVEFNIAHGVDAPCGNGGDGEADASTYSDHFMQMLAYNQVPLNYGTYYFQNTAFSGTWGVVYNNVLENLHLLIQMSQADGN